MSVIRIDIASEFKDKGFKKAEKATVGLDRQLKTLAKTLGATLSVREIYQFGKASVKAFSDDQKAAFRLTQTLNNLGLAFEDTRVTKFIADLESASGVLDDELRPAMQSLLMTTGSVAKSQELLGLALDISRATGSDVATVASDLSKAYVGQTRSLAKYNLGLARTELQTKSFSELQDILNKKFSGQSAAYLETYAGKVGVLNVAFANLQETVGEGLVDAFQILAGESGIGAGVSGMNAFGESIANVTRGIAVLTRSFFTFENLATTFKDFASGVLQYGGNFLMAFRELGKQNKPLFFPSSGDPLANERARKKAEAEALKRQKELAALQKKSATEAAKRAKEQAKRDREALALKRAGTIFDMDNIQVVAAMQGRVDAEQRLRLTALLALQTSNAEAAEKLSSAVLALNAPALANLGVMIKSGDTIDDVIEKIIKSQTKISLLGLGIKDIPKAKNPFEDWDSILDRLLAKIGSIRNAIAGFGNGDGMGTTNNGVTSNGNTLTPNGTISGSTDTGNQYITSPFDIFDVGGSNIIANSGMVMTGQASDTPNEAAARQRIADIFATIGRFGAGGAPTNVTVNVSGSVISDRDLQEAVVEGLYEVQKRGQAITISAIGL